MALHEYMSKNRCITLAGASDFEFYYALGVVEAREVRFPVTGEANRLFIQH